MFQNVRLNTENAVIETRNVNGYDALYFKLDEKTQCLIWDNGEYIFEFIFSIDYDTALQIAESIKQEE